MLWSYSQDLTLLVVFDTPLLLLLGVVTDSELPDMGACKQTLAQPGDLRTQHKCKGPGTGPCLAC